MTLACDVLVAGAGPAGMAAAAAAAESGCRVVVVDDNVAAGGQIWRGYSRQKAPRQPHSAAFRRLADRLQHARIHMETGARIVLQPAGGVVRIEREAGCLDIRYERLILATGARELFLPFPGWTLPGVVGAGGLQALVKSGLPIAGKRVVLAGSGPLLLAVAANLAKKGAVIAGLFEQASLSRLAAFGARLAGHPSKFIEGLRYRADAASVRYRTSSWVTRANGEQCLRSVTVSMGGQQREIACDYLGCGFHLVPNVELPRMLGCHVESGHVTVDAAQMTTLPHVYCAGELTGIGGLDKALTEGEIAGLNATGRPAAHLLRRRDRFAQFARSLSAAFAPRSEILKLADELTVICRCEDVPHNALNAKSNWREAKLHTRCGMGPCQGRVCGAAAQVLYGWTPDSVRPPLMPARVETLSTAPEEAPRLQ